MWTFGVPRTKNWCVLADDMKFFGGALVGRVCDEEMGTLTCTYGVRSSTNARSVRPMDLIAMFVNCCGGAEGYPGELCWQPAITNDHFGIGVVSLYPPTHLTRPPACRRNLRLLDNLEISKCQKSQKVRKQQQQIPPPEKREIQLAFGQTSLRVCAQLVSWQRARSCEMSAFDTHCSRLL